MCLRRGCSWSTWARPSSLPLAWYSRCSPCRSRPWRPSTGSRLLRHFMGDRTTQFVLGMFVSTFVYYWAVAESLPLVDENWEMPQLTLTAGVLLLLASFASIILLITHFSTMMQAPTIAAAAGAELLNAVRAGAPAGIRSSTHPGPSDTLPDPPMETEGFPVRVMMYGYIQYIDPDHLLALGRKKDIVIDLRRKTGHFVGPGDVVGSCLAGRSGGCKTGGSGPAGLPYR